MITGETVEYAADSQLGRFIFFGAIGLSGFAPNLISLYVLHELLAINYVIATVVATQLAIAWNFILLEQLVYRRARSGPLFRRVAAFAAINNLDLVLRVPLLAVLVERAQMNCLVATMITLVTMFLLRFLITDRLIYRLRSNSSTQQTAAEAPAVPSTTGDV